MFSNTLNRNYWWEYHGQKMIDLVWSHLEDLGSWRDERVVEVAWLSASYEREGYQAREVAYNGRGRGTVTEGSGQRARHVAFLENVPPSLNLIHDSVNTVGARLFAEPPVVEVRAYNANYDRDQQAQRLSDALNGVMNNRWAAKVLERVGMDGLKVGFGAVRPIVDRGKLRYERILYRQLWWDPSDAQWGEPQNLHYWQRISRSRLLSRVEEMPEEMFGVRKKGETWVCSKAEVLDAIRTAPEADPWGPYTHQGHGWASIYESTVLRGGLQQYADQLHVVHSWHLPGGPDSKDGRYVITLHTGGGQHRDDALRSDTSAYDYEGDTGHITRSDDTTAAGVVLYDGPWERQTFPIVWWSPFPHDEGIDGDGVGTLQRPYQEIVDRTFSKFQDNFDVLGHTKVLYWPGVADAKHDFAALGISFVAMPGQSGEPGFEIIPASPMSEQEFRYLQWVIESSRQFNGINEGMAQGGTKLGANASGIALMEEDDRAMDRLSGIERQYACWRLAVARETLNALDDAEEANPDFWVTWTKDSTSHRRKWAEISADHEEFHIDLEPKGEFANRRAGRIQRLIEYAQQGVVSPEIAGEELMGSADLRRVNRVELAGKRHVEHQLAIITDLKEDARNGAPTKHTDLTWADKLSLAELQEAERRGAGEEIIMRLMDYRREVTRMLEEEAAKAAPPMAPAVPGGAPPALEAVPGGLEGPMAALPAESLPEVI